MMADYIPPYLCAPNYQRPTLDDLTLDRLRKPPKGSDLIARRGKRNSIRTHEKKEKDLVRAKDKVCRWPHCENCRTYKPRLEVAHMEPKGSGGDHGVRTRADLMILLDFLTHQGPKGLERGERFIEPLTDAGTRGPCAFYVKVYSETKPGEWTWHCVGVERSAGVIDPTITERVIGEDTHASAIPAFARQEADMEGQDTERPADEQPATEGTAQPQGDGDPTPASEETTK